MNSFGWIVQNRIRKSVNIDNELTAVIKRFYKDKGYDSFQNSGSKAVNKRNCLRNGNNIRAIYTRNIKGEGEKASWAPYQYVKEMADDGADILLILGAKKEGSMAGKVYVLNAEQIKQCLKSKDITNKKHYSVNERGLENNGIAHECFNNEKELYEKLEKIG